MRDKVVLWTSTILASLMMTALVMVLWNFSFSAEFGFPEVGFLETLAMLICARFIRWFLVVGMPKNN